MKTRKIVEAVIEKLDFQPSPLARVLSLNKIQTAGILTIDIRESHYAEAAYAIENELFKIGYSAVLCNTGKDLDIAISYLHTLDNLGVAGIFCLGDIYCDLSKYVANNEVFSGMPLIFLIPYHPRTIRIL